MSKRATIAYLADRMQWPPGETGVSSNAMVRQAIGGDPVYVDEFPRDEADFKRCELAYQRAPAHLKERMAPILSRYRERLTQWQLGTMPTPPPAPRVRLRARRP